MTRKEEKLNERKGVKRKVETRRKIIIIRRRQIDISRTAFSIFIVSV